MKVICDVDKWIIGAHVSCSGSWTDSLIFERMDVYKEPHDHFSPWRYLLADSAYGTCIPPYKAPAANLPENKDFNFSLAKSRVRNEHCIGILKSRWGFLREMRQPEENHS